MNHTSSCTIRDLILKQTLLIAAKNGKNVYENQVNLIKNLPVNRNKYTIKSIFFNYWDEFVAICNAKGKKIRQSILDNVYRMIHCKDLSKGYLFFECPKCDNFHIQGFKAF